MCNIILRFHIYFFGNARNNSSVASIFLHLIYFLAIYYNVLNANTMSSYNLFHCMYCTRIAKSFIFVMALCPGDSQFKGFLICIPLLNRTFFSVRLGLFHNLVGGKIKHIPQFKGQGVLYLKRN